MEMSAEAENKVKEMKPWVRRFARFGYMSKGFVYMMIGILAVLAAIGPGGKTTGTKGALISVSALPFGEFLLWVIGIGLIGYSIWGLIRAFLDPKHEGKDAKGIIKRIGYFVSAVIYGNLAFGAMRLAMHFGSVRANGSEKQISSKLMEQPLGVWLVGIVGVIVLFYGAYEFWKGLKEKFMREIKTHELHPNAETLLCKLGKIGIMARGLVLFAVGFFFIRTAYTHDPNKSKGVGDALTELSQQPFGQVMLFIVAIGLILYGVYEIVRGRYQYMNFS